MERFKPRPEFLVGRSAKVSSVAEKKVRKLLSGHSDLVSPETVDLIVQREVALALQDYGEKRLRGYANDDYSQQPGLTAYLTPQGRERVVEMCEREGYPIVDAQIEEVTTDLIVLRLPRGIYHMGGGGAQFYQEVNTDWKQLNEANKPFTLGYDDVVRIEGDANELWQNAYYQWDGTPKT